MSATHQLIQTSSSALETKLVDRVRFKRNQAGPRALGFSASSRALTTAGGYIPHLSSPVAEDPEGGTIRSSGPNRRASKHQATSGRPKT